jgi:hypothetical protein
MNILKLALLASLRIAFFGALKAALFAYTLFLSAIDTCHAVTAGGRLSLEGDSLRLPESKVHRAVPSAKSYHSDLWAPSSTIWQRS